jgi:hypothetical protein
MSPTVTMYCILHICTEYAELINSCSLCSTDLSNLSISYNGIASRTFTNFYYTIRVQKKSFVDISLLK